MKVGDKVKVYFHNYTDNGVIVAITNNVITYNIDKHLTCSAHIKQCEVEGQEDTLLSWLRKSIVETEECRNSLLTQKLDLEEWDSTRIWLGEILAYRRLIQKLRGLDERSFQLEMKKGTL